MSDTTLDLDLSPNKLFYLEKSDFPDMKIFFLWDPFKDHPALFSPSEPQLINNDLVNVQIKGTRLQTKGSADYNIAAIYFERGVLNVL